MNNTFSSLTKFAAVAACALGLGSCNRAEYAMLPQGGSYHGVTRVATPVPASRPAAAVAESPKPAVAPIAAASPVAPAATAPVAPEQSKPATPAAATKSEVAALGTATASTQSALAHKPSLMHRLALAKVTKKLEKAVQKSGTARQHNNTAATSRIEGKLRQGLILVLIGVLVEILAAAISSNLIYLLGALLIIVGLVLIVLYLLDEL